MARRSIACLCAFISLCGINHSAQAADALGEIITAWKQQQQRFDTVRFAYEGTVHTPRAYTSSEYDPDTGGPTIFPPEDWTYDIADELLLDVAGKRASVRRTGESCFGLYEGKPMYYPLSEWHRFDGELYRLFRPHEENLGASGTDRYMTVDFVISEYPPDVFFGLEHVPLMFAAGYRYGEHSPNPRHIRAEIRRAIFRVRGKVTHDGVECIVLQSVPDKLGRFYEYWVQANDPLRIRRFAAHNRSGLDDGLWLDIDITYRDSEWGALPDSWSVSKYGLTTDKVKTYDVRLTDFEANPPVSDEDFVLEPPPGTRVSNRTRPKGEHEYLQPFPVVPGQINLPPEEVLMQQAHARSRFWMYAGLIGIVAIILGIAYRQRMAG